MLHIFALGRPSLSGCEIKKTTTNKQQKHLSKLLSRYRYELENLDIVSAKASSLALGGPAVP